MTRLRWQACTEVHGGGPLVLVLVLVLVGSAVWSPGSKCVLVRGKKRGLFGVGRSLAKEVCSPAKNPPAAPAAASFPRVKAFPGAITERPPFGSFNPRFWGRGARTRGHFGRQPLAEGKTHFLLIRDMTGLHGRSDPSFHSAWNTRSSTVGFLSRRPVCQARLRGHYKRENPSSPFFHYTRKKK